MLLHLLIESFLAKLLLSLTPILVNITGHLSIVLISASDGRLFSLRLLRLWVDGFSHILFDKVFLILRLLFELVKVFMVRNGRFYRSRYILLMRWDYLPTCIYSSLILLLNTTGSHAGPSIAGSWYWRMTLPGKGLGRKLRSTDIITIVLDNHWRRLLKVVDALRFRDVVTLHGVA